jgi:hypothetical protein
MSDERKERRIAIVGTAPTRNAVPYHDPTLEIWHLNDAWVLKPPRADRWFDLHPLDKMYFRKENTPVYAGDVPAGFFVRPAGHLEWLRKQTIPVYVQDAKALGSPSAVTFPRERCEQEIFHAFDSSPAWMVALALLEGVTELHVYGIHLATEWEYIHQRPNFESLLTLAAARGVKIVLPKGCPLLRSSHQYGYEEDPDVPRVALQRKHGRIKDEIAFMQAREKGRKWYQRRDPNYRARISFLTAQLMDCQLAIQHVTAGRAPVGY